MKKDVYHEGIANKVSVGKVVCLSHVHPTRIGSQSHGTIIKPFTFSSTHGTTFTLCVSSYVLLKHKENWNSRQSHRNNIFQHYT